MLVPQRMLLTDSPSCSLPSSMKVVALPRLRPFPIAMSGSPTTGGELGMSSRGSPGFPKTLKTMRSAWLVSGFSNWIVEPGTGE